MESAVIQRMLQVEARHWWCRARKGLFAKLIDRLALPPGAQILEVGCGAGGNLEMLSRFGEVSAIEADDAARQFARDRHGFDVRPGRLPDQVPFDGPFDLIALFDVLEHVDEDAAAIRHLAGKLADGGRLLVTVPAFPALWSRDDVVLHHRRRYTRATLGDAAGGCGLRVEYETYFNTLLFPLIAAARCLQRVAWREASAAARLPGPLVNAVLYRILACERWLLPAVRLPFGVSLLALLAKERSTGALSGPHDGSGRQGVVPATKTTVKECLR